MRLKCNRGLAAALDMRGHVFEALGRREEAIADFRRALARGQEVPTAMAALKRLMGN